MGMMLGTGLSLSNVVNKPASGVNPWIDANTQFYAPFTTDLVDDVGALTGTAYGDATISGGSLVCDGTGDYVAFAYDSVFSWSTPASKTIEFWAKIPTDAANGSYHGMVATGAATAGFTLGVYQGDFYTYLNSETAGTLSGALTIGDVWQHIALVVDNATNKTYRFVNGVSTGTPALGYREVTGGGAMHIGNVNPINASRYTNIIINDLRISNVSRYTTDFTPIARSTV